MKRVMPRLLLAFVLLAVAPAAGVVVTVHDDAGRPVAGAEVRGHVYQGGETGSFREETDADGRAEVAVPAGGSVSLVAEADGRVPVAVFWDTKVPDSVTMTLPPGTTVGGRVVDEDGGAVVGASVLLMAEPTDGYERRPGVPQALVGDVTVTTDAEGRWTYGGAPTDWRSFSVQIAHPDFAPDLSLRSVDDADALRDGAVEHVLLPGRSLAGTVVDAEGRPVAGAVVSLERGIGDRRFTTDADGRFDANHVPVGPARVAVRAEGFAPRFLKLAEEDATIAVDRGLPVAVRFRDAAGGAVRPFVRVTGIDGDGLDGPPDHRGEPVGDGGILSLRLAEGTTAHLDVAAAGFADAAVTVAADAGTVDVVLRRPTRVTVTARDAATGEAVMPDRVVLNVPVDDYARSWPATGDTTAIDVPITGPVSARVEAVGYALATTEAAGPDADGLIELTVDLTPADPIVGRVVNPDGTPAAGARVASLARPTAFNPGRPDAESFENPEVTADGEGRFRLPPGEATRLLARGAGGWAVADAGTDLIELTPWTPLEVAVTGRDDRPTPGVGLGWRGEPAEGVYAHGVLHLTDADGRATLPTTGAGRLSVTPPGSSATLFTLVPAGTTRLDLDLRGSVAGVAAAPDGLPDGWAFETATLCRPAADGAAADDAPTTALDDLSDAWPTRLTTTPDAAGRFDFDGVPPGRYLLTLTAGVPATGWACATGLPVARHQAWVTVGDGPLDLGSVPLAPVDRPEVGDPLPPMRDATTLDGGPFDVTDLAGKIIVIDFWATWCPPCVAALPEVRALHDEFADDDRVALLSASADPTAAEAAAFVAEHNLAGDAWHHAHVGLAGRTLQDYGVPGLPSVWVIDADGRVVARDVDMAEAAAVVRRLLEVE